STPSVRQQHRGLPIKRVVHPSDAFGLQAGGAHHYAVAEALAHFVHGLVEVHGLLRVGEGIHLVAAAHQVAEADAHQADPLSAVVQGAEELVYHGQDDVVARGVADAQLARVGVHVGVADLHGDAAGELLAFAQLVGEVFGHGGEQAAQFHQVDGVALESAFGADALPLVPRDHRAVVDTVRFAPQHRSVITEQALHEADRQLLHGLYAGHAHAAQQVRRFAAHAGDGLDGHRREEGLFGTALHLALAVGLGGIGGHFAHRFVDAEPKAVGQAGLLGDALAQCACQFQRAEEFLHAAEVHVEFVHAGLLEERHTFADDLGDLIALLHVRTAVAAQDDGLRAELFGGTHGHGAAHAEGPRLVAATGHHAAVAVAAHQHGLALQLRVFQAFHAYEEAVEVQVDDGTWVVHEMVPIDA